MTAEPLSETAGKKTDPAVELGPGRPKEVWIEPEIEALTLEQTETHFGHGLDGSFMQPADCTKS